MCAAVTKLTGVSFAATRLVSAVSALATQALLIAPAVATSGDRLYQIFGRDTAVAAPKALFGETLGAGGAMGMAAAIAWMDGVPVRTLVAFEGH